MKPYGIEHPKHEEHDGSDRKGRWIFWIIPKPQKKTARRDGKREVADQLRDGVE